jgi:CBS domain-containing protein
MRPIIELLKKREATVYSLSPNDTVLEALRRMADHNVGAMMVMDQGRLVGVLSERDYTRKIALEGRSSKDTQVKDIMTANVMTVTSQARTRECMTLMSQKKFRHLPVVDGDKVVGMISIRDIMDDIIAENEQTISQLTSYIAS